MVDEYIRRQDVLKGKKTGTFANGICLVAEPCVTVEYIESIEPADVAPVVHGKWIDEDPAFAEYFANCSVCGYEIDVHNERGYFNFCPNCGADMRGEQE